MIRDKDSTTFIQRSANNTSDGVGALHNMETEWEAQQLYPTDYKLTQGLPVKYKLNEYETFRMATRGRFVFDASYLTFLPFIISILKI